MPIDVNSDEWKNAGSYDPIEVEIDSLLSNNKEQAFSIKEIEEYLLENHQHLFPDGLVGEDAVEGAKAARQSIIANILENKYWHLEVSFKYISEEADPEAGLYFTWDGVGISPIAEVEEVNDPNPESPFGTLSSRFRQIEDDLDKEVSELEDRIAGIEYRLRQELDSY